MKNLTLIFALLFCLLGLQQQTHAQTRQADSLALVMLYNSTAGANWTTTWDLTMPMSSWHGVTLTGGRVTVVVLYNNNLIGTLPDLNLPNLTELELGYNQLTGSIPNFANLPNLTGLYLTRNRLTGSIPNFADLPNLTQLTLGNNQLTGSIPDFANLPNLTYLQLSINQLTGSIPNFANLPNLTGLYLTRNQLTGSIPTFANLPILNELHLYNNQLTGSIPNFSNLTNLIYLLLENNQLTGSIPTFTNLTNLKGLTLNNNQLTGSIPNFANLTNLTDLNLYGNQLTFSDILPNHFTLSALSRFYYAPQDSIGTAQTISVATGSNYTIDLVIDDTVTTNTYYWYKDGTLIDSTFGVNEYTISNFQASDIGVYTASITNSIVTNPSGYLQNLILYSRPITLDMGLSISQTQSIPTLQVQPNPVSDLLYINTQAVQGDYLVSLIDMQGRVVEQLQGSGSTVFMLPMAQQPAGIYIVRMQQADKIWQQKVVKQ